MHPCLSAYSGVADVKGLNPHVASPPRGFTPCPSRLRYTSPSSVFAVAPVFTELRRGKPLRRGKSPRQVRFRRDKPARQAVVKTFRSVINQPAAAIEKFSTPSRRNDVTLSCRRDGICRRASGFSPGGCDGVSGGGFSRSRRVARPRSRVSAFQSCRAGGGGQ